MTTISAGQNLPDVCLQELGSLAALFDLADAAGLAITDPLTPGQQLPVPASAGANADVAAVFAARAQRINTGDEPVADHLPLPARYFSPSFFTPDYFA
jgi:hypothetical protein